MPNDVKKLSPNKAFIVNQHNGVMFIAALGEGNFRLSVTIPATAIVSMNVHMNAVNISLRLPNKFFNIRFDNESDAGRFKEAFDMAFAAAMEYIHGSWSFYDDDDDTDDEEEASEDDSEEELPTMDVSNRIK